MSRTCYDQNQVKIREKRTKVSSLIIFIAVPLTLWASVALLNNTKYMITSLLVVIYTMVPFFLIFERRRPKAREIVIVAMMTALTVCVHIFFHLTIPIQIGTAMVVIAGISLGPEAGFLVGALSRFVCNFYLGQGPWTPWQMFCWGLMGFLGGLIFSKQAEKTSKYSAVLTPLICLLAAETMAYLTYLIVPGTDDTFWGWRIYLFGGIGIVAGALLQKGKLPITNITITVYTFCATVIIFGGIMNMAMMLYSGGIAGGKPVSLNTLRTLYITGFPYDLSHGIIAAACIFVIGKPMIEKMERIKVKYGIYR